MVKKNLFVLLILFMVGLTFGCSEKEGDGAASENGIEAYLIRVDGKEIGYISGKEEIEAFKELIKSEKIKEYGNQNSEIIKVAINSEIEVDKAICDPESLMSTEDMIKYYEENGDSISFSITVSEKDKVYISFETVYKNSSAYYEGTKVVSVKGEKGEKDITYHVTYVDGVESGKVVFEENVTKDAVNEVILVGTKKSTASTGSYAWPLNSVYITSSYGGRTLNGYYDFHLGVDLRASSGTWVYASDGGEVVFAGYNGSYGYLIKIKHDNGDYTYYAHLSKIAVSSGTRVYKGQYIALSGATGNVTGAHLHFEIRKNGSTVNPVSYLPSLKGVVIMSSEYLESCLVGTEAYQSHYALPVSFYSRKEQEECCLARHR